VFSKPLAILIGLGIFVLQVSQEYILVEPQVSFERGEIMLDMQPVHARNRKQMVEVADISSSSNLEVFTSYRILSCSAASNRRMCDRWCETM
jgi:hypothetical protein